MATIQGGLVNAMNGQWLPGISARELGIVARLAVRAAAGEAASDPHRLFAGIADPLWLWLNIEGGQRFPQLAAVLPRLPPRDVQLRFVGLADSDALAEAFAFHTEIRRCCAEAGRPITPASRILDFGCGWGRIGRFFLRDVPAKQIVGIDCMALAIDLCRETNPWSPFHLIDPAPPTDLEGGRFDLIFSFSVFSHLSEPMHQCWLAEFDRLLAPGGIFIATTRPREFIEYCHGLRQMDPLPEAVARLAALGFPDTDAALAAYDRGQYCHSPTGGGDELADTFYGETCIPLAYIQRTWTERFDFVSYIADRDVCQQNIVVMRKHHGPEC